MSKDSRLTEIRKVSPLLLLAGAAQKTRHGVLEVQKQKRLICVLMKDGTPRRVALDHADRLLDSGQAKRYISKSVYKALRAGITVKDLSTRNDKALKLQLNKALLDKEEQAKKIKKPKKSKG